MDIFLQGSALRKRLSSAEKIHKPMFVELWNRWVFMSGRGWNFKRKDRSSSTTGIIFERRLSKLASKRRSIILDSFLPSSGLFFVRERGLSAGRLYQEILRISIRTMVRFCQSLLMLSLY